MADAVTDTRSDLLSMLLTGGATGPLTGMVIGGWANISVGMLTEVCMTVVVVGVITLVAVMPVL